VNYAVVNGGQDLDMPMPLQLALRLSRPWSAAEKESLNDFRQALGLPARIAMTAFACGATPCSTIPAV